MVRKSTLPLADRRSTHRVIASRLKTAALGRIAKRHA
jgi:hypothetical protein